MMMRSSATRIVLAVLGVLLTLSLAFAKSIETSDPEPYQRNNQLDLSNDDLSLDTALIKYLLTKELLSRQRTGFDLDERQRKRSYWKQCAFNAVSCFGKK